MPHLGHPGFDFIIDSLSMKLLSMPHQLLTHTTLSEKNWYVFEVFFFKPLL
jgi:hypothetical protein